MATKKENTENKAMKIELPGIDIGMLTVNIIGDSPLIVHISSQGKTWLLESGLSWLGGFCFGFLKGG